MLTKASINKFDLTSIKETDNTLFYYANLYFKILVSGSSQATEIARRNDLSKFLSFFRECCHKIDKMLVCIESATKQKINHGYRMQKMQ